MPLYDDGKIPATITLTRFDRGYAIAQDINGIEFFVFHNAVEQTGSFDFEDLTMGSSVRLRPITGPKGMRGIEVEILSV